MTQAVASPDSITHDTPVPEGWFQQFFGKAMANSQATANCAGIDMHKPGAKADQGKVRMHLITGGMARALTEVARVATFGAAKYTDGGWVYVPDGFRRYEDAQQRHAALRHMGETHDPESKLLHLSHEAWNALAKLDLYLREQEDRQSKAIS